MAQREIAPKLCAFSLKEIGYGDGGVSLAACSRIGTGAKLPHPGHCEALRKLAGA